jgi:hypothetical protein
MAAAAIESIEVFLGGHKNPTLFGPIPGRRLGDLIAHESQAPATFTPWPGRFLDRHLHTARFPQSGFSDFPPAAIRPLAALPELFANPVTWPE